MSEVKSKSPEEPLGPAGLGNRRQEELSGERRAQDWVVDDQKRIGREGFSGREPTGVDTQR